MRYLYSRETKEEAIRRVVHGKQRVRQVAAEMKIGEGSLFFWLRRHRQGELGNRALVDQIDVLERRIEEMLNRVNRLRADLSPDAHAGAAGTRSLES